MGREEEPHPLTGIDPTAGVEPDFEPLYELEEGDYIRIINNLSNLVIGEVQRLQELGDPDGARSIAEKASLILTDYDPDVAELVHWASTSGRDPKGKKKHIG